MGHVLPVLPLALELRRRGHELHWVVGPGGEGLVVEQGIEATVAGLSVAERQAGVVERHPDLWTRPSHEAG